MGKTGGRKGPKDKKAVQKRVEVNNDDDEEEEEIDLLDNVDKFDAAEEELLMLKTAKLGKANKDKDVQGGIEELYALSGDSDSEDEDEEEDVRAWGGKKKHFYGGNPNEPVVDSGEKHDDLDEAEAEEAESKALQLKQLGQLDEQDFLDAFVGGSQEKRGKKKSRASKEEITLDVSRLTKKEKQNLFHRESPEFAGIMKDFATQMEVVRCQLQPIVDFLHESKLPLEGPGAEFIVAKHQLCLNYCTNIAAYLMFKSKRANLKFHPVTGRLVQYKQLLEQAKPLDDIVMPQVDQILKAVQSGDGKMVSDGLQILERMVRKARKRSRPYTSGQPKKKLRILSKPNPEAEEDKAEESDTGEPDFTTDERIALEVYQAMKSKKKKVMVESDSEPEDFEGSQEDQNNKVQNGGDDEEEEEEQRRAITYQIAKNKGLAPKRSKLQRNPRVKHRHKFEKAKVRRKGQVREVRKEVKKYAGEMSGINARVKKGVKLG